VRGDLFTCPSTDALAHCISEDCRMGAGIAVLFKKHFHGEEELLAQSESELPLLTSALPITLKSHAFDSQFSLLPSVLCREATWAMCSA